MRERKGDIYLLFRKFAADFAERYRMPVIRLSHDAQVLISEYAWPGNIRQLMSVVQRISALEQTREISASVVRKYLPVQNISNENLPALASKDEDMLSNSKLLLHMIMSLKKELASLKERVDIMSSGQSAPAIETSRFNDFEMVDDIMSDSFDETPAPDNVTPEESAGENFENPENEVSGEADDMILENSPEDGKNSFSIKDKYDEMIRACLLKHNGNRKKTAIELGISERTLYRKIDRLGLEGKKKKRK